MNSVEIASFVAELRFEDLTEGAKVRARQALLDTIGTALGGSETPTAEVAGRFARSESGTFAAVAPGAPRLSAAHAAFLSCVHASALDYDDGHYLGGAIHPSSVIVPTLLVASTDMDFELGELLTAQVAAYDVAVRLAHLLWPTGPQDRWHCTGTAASVGAAVGAAKLRGADAEGIHRAMMIAWSHAPQAALQFPMAKEAIGWAGASALTSALLAEAGWMSHPPGSTAPAHPQIFPPTPFDVETVEHDAFVTSIGTRFEIENSYLKPYAACRYTHTSADVLVELKAEGMDIEAIETLTVLTHSWANFLDEKEPRSLEHAQYSYPFVLGAVATLGGAGPREISARAILDGKVKEFASRVSVRVSTELDAFLPNHYSTALVIRLAGGSVIETEPRLIARGDPESPLSDEFLRAKFLEMAEPTVAKGADSIMATVAGGGTTRDLWAGLAHER